MEMPRAQNRLSRLSLTADKKQGAPYVLSDIMRLIENADPQKYSKWKFELEVCPFPCLKEMCSLVGVQKIILAQLAEEKLTSTQAQETPKPAESETNTFSDDEDLELTGQPLECNFFAFAPTHSHAQKETENMTLLKCNDRPVKIQEARSLLGVYNCLLADNKYLTENAPLIVLCDGKDSLRTALLGSFCHDGSITTISASVTGPFPVNSLPSLSSLEEEHLHTSCTRSSALMTETSCRYKVLGDATYNQNDLSSLTVDCRWKKATSILESPNAHAICKLSIKVVPGEERSPAYAIYKELLFLKMILQGITTGEVAWITESSTIPILDKMNNLISGVKDGCHWRKTESTSESEKTARKMDVWDFDSFLEGVVMGKRQNMEFTDYLWTVLMECTCYNDLKESLGMMMKAIRNRTIQPVVLHTNKTKLGSWIKRVSENQNLDDISLEGTEPLKVLLELGIEKLRKDYRVVFVGLGLATEESLKPFLSNKPNLEKIVHLLHKLHCTLELIVMCKTYVKLGREILGDFARQAVKYYLSVDSVLPTHQFHFPIQISAVQKVIRGYLLHC